MNLQDSLLRRLSGLCLTDFPREIQIQTVSRCNAKCIFCPASTLPPEMPHGKMDEGLFKKIIDEAVDRRPSKIKPYLMNEPLVDKRLPAFIKYIDERRHSSTVIEIYTNGALLDERMSEELIESGLDRLIVSFQGVDPDAYEKTMVGLKYGEVLKNLENFITIRERRNARRPYFEIRMVNTGFVQKEIDEHRKFWCDRGIKLVVKPLENRLNKSIEESQLNVRRWNPRSFCRRLFSYAWILFNGDLILCCCDWERKHILGNVSRTTIANVWGGAKYKETRQKFIKGRVNDIICGFCKIDS
ncbi:MAG: radical SAM/SPASM domain-containing protein [Pseudomonadota bacterium]